MCTWSLMKLEDYLLKETEIGETYIAVLEYSHDLITKKLSREVFETCYNNICWYNDWWEGEPYIKLIGLIPINAPDIPRLGYRNEVFNNG